MRLLVTGGAGRVGSVAARQLAEGSVLDAARLSAPSGAGSRVSPSGSA